MLPGDIRDALAWQAPRLVFLDTPLSDVVAQFNEHNRVQLVIGDGEIGQRPVGGTFRADQAEAFVRLLEDSREVAVERPDAERIILRKPALLDPRDAAAGHGRSHAGLALPGNCGLLRSVAACRPLRNARSAAPASWRSGSPRPPAGFGQRRRRTFRPACSG